MKKTYPHLLVACLLLTAMQCCKTDPKPTNPIDQLPPATQTGENTFGCLVNGEAFVVTNTSKMNAVYQGGILFFGGGKIDQLEYGITIVLNDPLQATLDYSLTNLLGKGGEYVSKKGNDICYYSFDNTFSGKVNFSNIDRTNFIISGTFEFSTATTDCDTVHITDGRFDMQYIP